MEIIPINKYLLDSLKIGRGRIVDIDTDGRIKVSSDTENLHILCDFLRTSSSPPPDLYPGDAVLYVTDETAMGGCVLGVIQKYRSKKQSLPNNERHPDTGDKFCKIQFKAEEKIELCCGKSSLKMNKEGKIIIYGTSVTSRSTGVNKIKGAAVRIN